MRIRSPDSILQIPYQGIHELVSISADSQSHPSACFHHFRRLWSCEVGLPNELFLIPSVSSCSMISWPDLLHFCDFDLGPRLLPSSHLCSQTSRPPHSCTCLHTANPLSQGGTHPLPHGAEPPSMGWWAKSCSPPPPKDIHVLILGTYEY